MKQVLDEQAVGLGWPVPVELIERLEHRKAGLIDTTLHATASASAFACTMLLSRRLYPNASNHRLSTLVQLLGLPKSGRAHRAMVDAEMTSHLPTLLQGCANPVS